MNNKENFAHFGEQFQKLLVGLIIKDNLFSNQLQEVIKYNFFEFKYLQLLTEKIYKFKNEFKQHPSYDSIKTIINTEFATENGDIQNQIKEYYKYILSLNGIDNEEFIKSKSLDFCKKQTVKESMIRCIDLLQKSSFDEIEKDLISALRKGNDNNIGYDYRDNFEERYKEDQRHPISCGFDEVDKIIAGGFGQGELIIIVAPTGAGKSHLLVHFCSQALKNGKIVVYYTLELSNNMIGKRTDSCISGVALDELKLSKDEVLKSLNKLDGDLTIKEYPTKSASVNIIKNHLEKLRQKNIMPDLIIVDYLDLLKSQNKYESKRHELESIAEQLRATAQEFKCPLVTATQSNRESLEQEHFSMDKISEAYAKTFCADLVMLLARNRENKQSNTATLTIGKNRQGNDFKRFNLFFDPSNVSIKILGEDIINNDNNVLFEVDNDKMSKKYKEYLKKKK